MVTQTLTEDDDSLVGSVGNDTIFALGGDDSIHGNAGWDWMSGGAGNDTIGGGDGDDTIYGGDGDDVLDALIGRGHTLARLSPTRSFVGNERRAATPCRIPAAVGRAAGEAGVRYPAVNLCC